MRVMSQRIHRCCSSFRGRCVTALAIATSVLVSFTAAHPLRGVDKAEPGSLTDSVVGSEALSRQNADDPSPSMESCSYGELDAPFGRVIGYSIALTIVASLTVFFFVLLGGGIGFVLFSWPGLVVAWAVWPIIMDRIVIAWETWRYFGPGDDYVRRKSGNRYRFFAFVYSTVINKALILGLGIYAAFFGVTEDDTPLAGLRAFIGFFASQIVSGVVTWYSYRHGVPSYFRGSDGDTFNGPQCSGSEAWGQMSNKVRFTEIAFYVGPIVGVIPVIGTVFDLAEIVVSIIVIVEEQNRFHRSTAIFDIVFAIMQFLWSLALPGMWNP